MPNPYATAEGRSRSEFYFGREVPGASDHIVGRRIGPQLERADERGALLARLLTPGLTVSMSENA
jgi:hypothetical protein